MQRFNRTNAIAAGIAGVSLLAFSAMTARAQTMPVSPAVKDTAVTTTMPGDMMADKLQGLHVYTLNPDAAADRKVAAPAPDTGVRIVTRDEYTRMTKGYAKVGEIDDLIVSPEGKVKEAVVSVGGFLGVAERNVALGWSDLTFVRTSEGDVFAYVGKTKDQLKALPEFRTVK